MPFTYPNRPHARKHGLSGYTDYASYKPWLRDEFCFRCVYCLERERWYPNWADAFGVEHVLAKSDPANAAFINDYDFLVYGCNRCNSAKNTVPILNPCATAMATHLRVGDDGAIHGLTAEGEFLIEQLGLDEPNARTVRLRYLRVLWLYQLKPDDEEIRKMYLDYFGFPTELPNLEALRPHANSRAEGLRDCYFRQKTEDRLPEVYL
jgi:hypothetical protein